MYYLGTCIDIDETGETYGFDPTEFAQAEDRASSDGIDISADKFFKDANAPIDVQKILLRNKNSWYAYDEELNVSWGYEPDEDIHYIFHGIPTKTINESYFDKHAEPEFIEYQNRQSGCYYMDMIVDSETVCTVSYTRNPNVVYTQDKNKEDYIYI